MKKLFNCRIAVFVFTALLASNFQGSVSGAGAGEEKRSLFADSSLSLPMLSIENVATGIAVAAPAFIYAGEKLVGKFTSDRAKRIAKQLGSMRKGAGAVSAFALGYAAAKVMGESAKSLIPYLAGGTVAAAGLGQLVGRGKLAGTKTERMFGLTSESRKEKTVYAAYLVSVFQAGMAVGLKRVAVGADRDREDARVEAATKIQAVVRGRVARKEAAARKKAEAERREAAEAALKNPSRELRRGVAKLEKMYRARTEELRRLKNIAQFGEAEQGYSGDVIPKTNKESWEIRTKRLSESAAESKRLDEIYYNDPSYPSADKTKIFKDRQKWNDVRELAEQEMPSGLFTDEVRNEVVLRVMEDMSNPTGGKGNRFPKYASADRDENDEGRRDALVHRIRAYANQAFAYCVKPKQAAEKLKLMEIIRESKLQELRAQRARQRAAQVQSKK